MGKLQSIERFTKAKIRREQIPTAELVEGRRSDALYEKLRATLESVERPKQSPVVERLFEQGYAPTEVAVAILHHFAAPADRRAEEDDVAAQQPRKEFAGSRRGPPRSPNRPQGGPGKRPAKYGRGGRKRS